MSNNDFTYVQINDKNPQMGGQLHVIINNVLEKDTDDESFDFDLCITYDYIIDLSLSIPNDSVSSEADSSHKRSRGLALRREGEPGLCNVLPNSCDSYDHDSSLYDAFNVISPFGLYGSTIFNPCCFC